MIKKLLALTLAVAMVLSLTAVAGYKADTYADAADINSDCEDAIELLYALNIMKGDNNGKFNPNATITRAEIAKMVYVVLNKGEDDKAVNYTGAKMFSDVAVGSWYEGYVNYCAATKLVQGRGNGTFGPNDPIKTAEAAKMLLTAIGYSAEARGYTGAKWDTNVLADAAILGLMDDYKASVTGYAPRQWVAVMFYNMLTKCLTYTTMAPTFSGLLTSGTDAGTALMGKKYFNLDKFTSVAMATSYASIDGKDYAEKGVLFDNDKEIKGTGLLAADLGQEYVVIYDTESMSAYSVRSLSETAESRTLDMEYDVTHGTSSNKAQNKYIFTVGEMEAYFEAYEIPVLGTMSGNFEIDVDELRDLIDDPARNNDIWKAIDTDADGKIDYFFVDEYRYAYVADEATSNKYGTYIEAYDVETDKYLEYNKEDRLYIEDCIITDDEIEKDNIVKYGVDLDEDMYTMEVLPMGEGVELEERDTKDGIYVLGGEEYQIADRGYAADAEELLNKSKIGTEMDFVVDGDLIVWIAKSDSNFTDMADINDQLVLVLDANDEYSNNTIREKNAIEYMTIDGETHVSVYLENKAGVPFTELEHLEDQTIVEGRLFQIKTSSKGVYVVELEDAKINEQLDAATSLLDGYDERAKAELDTTGTAKLDGDKIVEDNLFFYGNEDGWTVLTMADLDNGTCKDAYAQVLTLDNAKGTRTTVVGGYIYADIESETDDGYLYITKIGRETTDGIKVDVVFEDGTEKTVTVENERAELTTGWLYSYKYTVLDDTYELALVFDMKDEADEDEIIDLDGSDVIFADKTDASLSKLTIAITTIIIDRDQNADFMDEERDDFDWEVEGIEFVDLDDLELDMIENDVDDRTYTQFTDYIFADDVFYVVVWQVMDTYDGHDMIEDSPLAYMA